MAGLCGEYMCVVFLGLLAYSQAMKLELTQVIFRSGERSPIANYPGNKYCQDQDCWSSLGQLTQEGMKQEYDLGQLLHSRYVVKISLLNKTYYHRKEVSVRSTDVDRTLMSAQVVLSSLFPPHNFQIFDKSLPWQPIPVHTVPRHDDPLLRAYDMEEDICPRYTKIYNSQNKRQDYQIMTKKNQAFMKWVQKQAKVNYTVTLSNIHLIWDPLFYQANNMEQKLPDWVNNTVMDRLKELSDFGLASMFEGRETHRLTAGPLVDKLLEHMRNKSRATATKPASPKKMYLYSADESTLALLLSALQVYNGRRPPFGSAVFLELYNDETLSQGYYVVVLYRNVTGSKARDVFINLTPHVPGCHGFNMCPIDDFMRLTNAIIPSDWGKECGSSSSHKHHHHHNNNNNNNNKKSNNTNLIIAVSVVGGLFMVGLFVLALTVCTVRRRSPESQPLVVNKA